MERKLIFSPREIKDTVTENGREILRIDFSIPHFSYIADESKNKDDKTAEKINSYYEKIGNAAYHYFKKIYPASLPAKAHEKPCRTAVIRCRKTFECRELFSVMTDVSFCGGASGITRRFSETWSSENGDLILPQELFDTGKKSISRITDMICSKISLGEGGFDYKKNAERYAKKYFDAENFYLVPKGIAFYYKNDVILQKSGRVPAYIVHFDDIKLKKSITFE